MIKLKTLKTAQSIRNYDSLILFCDKFDLTYYPDQMVVDVFYKSKNYRCIVPVPNIAYMEPMEVEAKIEKPSEIAKDTKGNKKA
jgi:hypothetical protein